MDKKHFFQPKLVCIARCKNEIHIIKKWYESLPFVDIFIITDNNSTDGTYEYLKSLPNVIVVRLDGFDEGRDFQILLKMAKALDPEWLLKIDCDEIFEDIGIKNFHKLLEQKRFDSFFFRKFEFDYRLRDDEVVMSKNREKRQEVLFLARNNKHMNIRDVKIHVGGLMLFKKPAICNFRVKHYSKPSKEKSNEKFSTYESIKDKKDRVQDYSSFIEYQNYFNNIIVEKFENVEQKTLNTLNKYGMPCLYFSNKKHKIISPQKNKKYYYLNIKLALFSLLRIFQLSKIFWIFKSKK